LNRLGFYQPLDKIGITGIPDTRVFEALKSFQKAHDLPVTGIANPDDKTIQKLNQESSKTPEGHYIWRTVEDDKVRNAHADYNRTVRDWSDDPDPGEEFNCRCWAEPVKALGLTQIVISSINDSEKIWDKPDFAEHFYTGKGKEKTLEEIGLLGPIISHAQEIMFDNVLKQVEDRARIAMAGVFTGSWDESYHFGEVSFSIGGATIKGRFGGTVKKIEKVLAIEAHADYEFSDTFTDPFNKREQKIGSSDLADMPYEPFKPWWSVGNIGASLVAADTEYMGTPFEITGRWRTRITGSIQAE